MVVTMWAESSKILYKSNNIQVEQFVRQKIILCYQYKPTEIVGKPDLGHFSLAIDPLLI